MKKNTGLMIGIAGVLMGVISLFLPFAKQWKESYSMVGMAKLYALSIRQIGIMTRKQRCFIKYLFRQQLH